MHVRLSICPTCTSHKPLGWTLPNFLCCCLWSWLSHPLTTFTKLCTSSFLDYLMFAIVDRNQEGHKSVVCVCHRVAQLKRSQLTILLVTFECAGQIQWFLANVNCIQQEMMWCDLETDYILRKTMKHSIQQYIFHLEILSTFQGDKFQIIVAKKLLPVSILTAISSIHTWFAARMSISTT